MFILVMQFLWRYIDDMVGKGLEFSVLAELLFYASVQVVPMALPLAILLASLMTFGNLGENYELTAIKAAGISLPRTMAPLIILTVSISIGAFWFSNNVMPVANLKLFSLLYSVKQARPELDIKERIFYDGVDDFRIKIDEKDQKTGMMHNLMIYDHRDKINRNTNVTIADSGKMQVSDQKNYIMLTLYNGITYDEKVSIDKKRSTDRDKQLYRRDKYDEQTVMIELQGMNFSKTDESLFKSLDRMKNLTQLRQDEDSLITEQGKYVSELSRQSENFYFQKGRYSLRNRASELTKVIDSTSVLSIDTLFNKLTNEQKKTAYESAIRSVQDHKYSIDEKMSYIDREQKKINRHQMEIHRKFTLSFACLIFFFIGAPLGAIIRKGGLGMPVVISVLFFIFYYMVDTMGAKFAREGVWQVYQGMWLSSAVLAPIGIFLTYKSSTDSALLNSEAYTIFFEKVKKELKKRFGKKQ
jgi:lipopolysaccharide export system permease protein